MSQKFYLTIRVFQLTLSESSKEFVITSLKEHDANQLGKNSKDHQTHGMHEKGGIPIKCSVQISPRLTMCALQMMSYCFDDIHSEEGGRGGIKQINSTKSSKDEQADNTQ